MLQDGTVHQPAAHSESELVDALEPDQLAVAAGQPLPRLRLSQYAEVALWALRIFVLIVTGLVIYTFVVQLVRAP